MTKKILGILGGMGPKATAVFFERVIDRTEAGQDQEHIDIVMLNHASIPDRTKAILEGKTEAFLQAVERDLRIFETAGVNHIAIPCNTSHYFYDEIQRRTEIPIINMVEETVKIIHKRYGPECKVGILATAGTLKSGVYDRVCHQYGLSLYLPDEGMRRQAMKIIYENVKKHMDVSPEELESLILSLVEQGCACVILACTELSCISLGDEAAVYAVDAMEVLVERAIQLSNKGVKGALITKVE